MKKLISGAVELKIRLTEEQINQFEVYYQTLEDWNDRVNLTTITDYDEVQVKHFLDSLTVASAIDARTLKKPLRIIDVGTGGGFPGVPLKIAFPQIYLTLLEATGKKARFLEDLVVKLKLKDVRVVTGRAEEIARHEAYRESYDIVLSRAVAALPALVEMTLPFCKVGGSLVAQKKGDIDEELEQAGKAIDLMGGALKKVKPVTLKELQDNRCLVIVDKVNPTPAQYPRRPGMPEKRPIL